MIKAQLFNRLLSGSVRWVACLDFTIQRKREPLLTAWSKGRYKQRFLYRIRPCSLLVRTVWQAWSVGRWHAREHVREGNVLSFRAMDLRLWVFNMAARLAYPATCIGTEPTLLGYERLSDLSSQVRLDQEVSEVRVVPMCRSPLGQALGLILLLNMPHRQALRGY